MSEIIILSSDDEDCIPVSPPVKKNFEAFSSKRKKSVESPDLPGINNINKDDLNAIHVKKKIKPTSIIDCNDNKNLCVIISDDEETLGNNIDENNIVHEGTLFISNHLSIENENDLNSVSSRTIENDLNNVIAKTSEKENSCSELLSEFIELCIQKIDSNHKDFFLSKVNILRKLHDKVSLEKENLTETMNIIKSKIEFLKEHTDKVAIVFCDLYNHLKLIYEEEKLNGMNAEVYSKIKKLNKTLEKVNNKIKQLEMDDAELEDDENSNYIQMQRYRERAVEIYKKICSLRNTNPYESRVTHKRLKFYPSKFSEINKELNKRYKDNSTFPSYYDIDKLIQNCVKQHNIIISPIELNQEVRTCFEKLGEILRKRRQKDLCDTINGLVDMDDLNEIPNDAEITVKLEEHKKEAEIKLNSLIEEYVIKQEKGQDTEEDQENDKESNKECS